MTHKLPSDTLDVKDRKILDILAKDARTPCARIAKHIRLSKDAVRYRIARLENRGAIAGYRAVVDTERLGFDNYHILIQWLKQSKESQSRMVERMAALPFVRSVLLFMGKYDVEVALIARGVREFERYLDALLGICSDLEFNYEVLLLTKTYRSRLADQSQRNQEETLRDATDVLILRALADDARLPMVSVGKRVGISSDAVAYRLRSLVGRGVIAGWIPVIDYRALDKAWYMVLFSFKWLGPEEKMKVHEVLSTDERIFWSAKAIGRFTSVAYLAAESPEDALRLWRRLADVCPSKIRDAELLLVDSQKKFTYMPLVVDAEVLKNDGDSVI
ncbi:MAG: AsnC family transcriptional regulator [Nanoarchaeota archaeon]